MSVHCMTFGYPSQTAATFDARIACLVSILDLNMIF